MAKLSVDEPDALMCARPDLWEPWAGNCPGPPGHERAAPMAKSQLSSARHTFRAVLKLLCESDCSCTGGASPPQKQARLTNRRLWESRCAKMPTPNPRKRSFELTVPQSTAFANKVAPNPSAGVLGTVSPFLGRPPFSLAHQIRQ